LADGQSTRIILASASEGRRMLLENAGVPFDVVRPDVDERAVEAAVENSGVTPSDLATILAEAKATEVSLRHPDALVIGADQTMALDDRLFHKPADMEGARRHLLALSGRMHELHSGVVLARAGIAIWRHVDTARLTMREMSPEFIGRYLSAVGNAVLQSVGGYQIEGRGIQLFETIEGSHFTIVGLPLLSLLAALRENGALDG
jgi:septum formation protein